MKHFYIFFLLIIPLYISAQTNYHQGYVVKANGDTVKGYIDYREWDRSPKTISFKHTISDKQTDKYTPNTANSFEIGGMDKYVTYSGKLSMDKNSFPDLPQQLDTNTLHDKVFLKRIYKGATTSLFEHKDDIKARLFLVENNKMPVELIYHQYYGNENNNLVNVDRYKQQLIQLALSINPGDNKTQKAINYIRFRESDITDILRMINKDNGKNNAEQNGTADSRLFIGVSYLQTATKFIGDIEFVDAKSNSSVPQVSIGLDFLPNKNTQKLILRNELSFHAVSPKFSVTSDHRFPNNVIPFTPAEQFYFNQYTITLTPQVIYNLYNKDNTKFFIGIGVPINYSLYNNITFVHNGSTYVNTYEFRKTWVGAQFRVGVTLNKTIDIFALYNTDGNITPYIPFGITRQSYGLGAHYLFK